MSGVEKLLKKLVDGLMVAKLEALVSSYQEPLGGELSCCSSQPRGHVRTLPERSRPDLPEMPRSAQAVKRRGGMG
eukprot:Skav211780  [mRNA]  locus=scaffold305:108760:117989:+ [translate_table: standard]